MSGSNGRVRRDGDLLGMRTADLLMTAQRVLTEEFDFDDKLTRAALHLVECATAAVESLPKGDVEAARDVLGSARAAVQTATSAVRHVHDSSRARLY